MMGPVIQERAVPFPVGYTVSPTSWLFMEIRGSFNFECFCSKPFDEKYTVNQTLHHVRQIGLLLTTTFYNFFPLKI
jgi:hypothetical protein